MILLIIIVAVFFLTFNLVRSLTKAIGITIAIMFLLGMIIGYVIINDAKDFSNTIKHNKTTYLLSEEGEIKTGFQANKLNISTFNSLNKKEIKTIREKPPGKIFIINKEIFNTSIKIQELEELGTSVEDMLESESEDMRSQVFGLLIINTIKEKGPIEMILHIKEENITIEPKTPVIYVITSTPRQLYKQVKELVVQETVKQIDNMREG